MEQSPTLFDPGPFPSRPALEPGEVGEKRKIDGTRRVLARTGEAWKKAVEDAIGQLAQPGASLTSDDVLAALERDRPGLVPCHPNAVGAAIRAAAVRGVILPTGRVVKSNRPSAHARLIRVWRAAA